MKVNSNVDRWVTAINNITLDDLMERATLTIYNRNGWVGEHIRIVSEGRMVFVIGNQYYGYYIGGSHRLHLCRSGEEMEISRRVDYRVFMEYHRISSL